MFAGCPVTGIPARPDLPGIDHRNASLVVKAIARAAAHVGHLITHPDGRQPGP